MFTQGEVNPQNILDILTSDILIIYQLSNKVI